MRELLLYFSLFIILSLNHTLDNNCIIIILSLIVSVRAIAKLSILDGDVDHQMTHTNAHHVVSNDGGARG